MEKKLKLIAAVLGSIAAIITTLAAIASSVADYRKEQEPCA
jgi:hypothetical protein